MDNVMILERDILMRMCSLEVDQQMTVFDDVAKLLKDAGGLLGNDLRAQEVYHIESGKLLLQYWVSSDPAIKGRIVKNRAF